jgi:peptidoglycan hydrolase CwlO-like protein
MNEALTWNEARFLLWLLVGCGSVVAALLAVVWGMLNRRIDNVKNDVTELRNEDLAEVRENTGRHFSNINDLRVDMREMQTKVENHVDKFDEIKSVLVRIEEKIDNFRDRRNI